MLSISVHGQAHMGGHDSLTNLPLQFSFKNLLNFGTSLFELHTDLQIISY